MRLRNTSGIPTELVRRIIRFVCPPDVSGVDIMVKGSQFKLAGRSYTCGGAFHGRAVPFITARIGGEKWFPSKPETAPRGRGYLPIPWLASRAEALVYLLAHELRHQWQYKHPRGYRVWGARGKISERDADAYAIRKLRAWRREG